jgi:hypothetical protein
MDRVVLDASADASGGGLPVHGAAPWLGMLV